MVPLFIAAVTAAKSVPVHIKTLPVQVQPTVMQAPVGMTPTWFQAHAAWLTHGVAGIGIIAAISLIVLLAVQTTKQEGLSGTIGGKVETAYRGRPGMDEQLKRLTGFVAAVFVIAFVVLSLTGI